MKFRELEDDSNKRLLRFYESEKNREYEEAREILRRLFPQERVIEDRVEFYKWDEMFGYHGTLFSELLDCKSQDSLSLRESSEIRTCLCGCNLISMREKFYIRSAEFDEDKAKRAGRAEKGWMEKHLLSRGMGINEDSWVQIAPDFYEIIPGAMDEWLKMQFEPKARD